MMFNTYKDVAKAVDGAGGVLTVHMHELRDVEGAGRLGNNVVGSISRNLAAAGLRHWPQEMPTNQWDQVRLYGASTLLAEMLDLLDRLGTDEDAELVELLNADDAQAKIRKIKKLVCA